MVVGAEALRIDEGVGQGRVLAEHPPVQAEGVVGNFFLAALAVGHQDVARVLEGEHGLQARGDVVGEQRDRARRRHRGQQRVADAVLRDGVLDVLIQRLDMLAREIGVLVVKREGALFLGQIDRGQIGRALDRAQPAFGQAHGLGPAVTRAAHDQRIGQTGHAQTDAALGLGLVALGLQREIGDVDDVVHHPHRPAHQFVQLISIDPGTVPERIGHQPRQIDRAQQAGAVRRQRLFAAGVGGMDGFAVMQVVPRVDAVDEDHARFGIGVGAAHDLVPKLARRQRPVDRAAEGQFPGRVFLDRLHEGVRDQDRKIEHAKTARLTLGLYEVLDIRMVAAHGRHHGAPARPRRHDRPAHGIPNVHERQRARGVGPDPFDQGPLGPQRREVIPDAAALLHGQRGLFQIIEDARHVVGDLAHDEAIEQGNHAVRTGTGNDAARRQELEIRQRVPELRSPGFGIVLARRQGRRHPVPGVVDGLVHGPPVRRLQPVFHVPDLLGNGGDRSGRRGRRL